MWCATHEKNPYVICGQRRLWSACANAQADQGLRCPLTVSMDAVVMSTNRECPDQMNGCARSSGPLLFGYGIRAFPPRCASLDKGSFFMLRPMRFRWRNNDCYLILNKRKRTFWHVRPTKTQISLPIQAVWSECSLSAWRNSASLGILNVPSEDSDQTTRMRSLIWIFAGRTCPKVRFLMLRYISSI